MSEEHKQIVEEIRRREQDIRIMELLLKHKLTRKRAEYKLLIMYYKACNVIAKAKLMMSGIDDDEVRMPCSPQTRRDIKQVYLLEEHFQRRSL